MYISIKFFSFHVDSRYVDYDSQLGLFEEHFLYQRAHVLLRRIGKSAPNTGWSFNLVASSHVNENC